MCRNWGFRYDVTKVTVAHYDADAAPAPGSRTALHTDTTIFTACATHLTLGGRSHPPSKRYHTMLVGGAELSGLDPAYIAELEVRQLRQ